MTYNPELTTSLDRIRFIIGDRTIPEIFPDETYDAVLLMYSNWKYAAADMADAMAVYLDRQLSSVSIPNALSAGWADQAKTLREKAKVLRAEAANEDAASASSSVGIIVSYGEDEVAVSEWG